MDYLKKIFSDFKIISLKQDIEHGILLKARKPSVWRAIDLSNIPLYSMVLGRRTRDSPNIRNMPFSRRLTLRLLQSKVIRLLS